MRKYLFAIFGLLIVSLAPGARAAQVTGLINFAGSDTYDTTNRTITFIGAQEVTSDTGDLAAFGTCFTCATFQNIDFGAGFTPVTNEITASNNGLNFALDLTGITDVTEAPFFLDVTGSAVLHLTGFDPTPGTFLFSSQGPSGPEVSFSTTAFSVATPEPMSLSILGVSLIGLGLVRKYTSKKE